MSSEDYMKDDQRLIEEEFNALITDYLNSNHRRKVELITKAFEIANEAHAGAKRRSGEPYIMHPLAVARIVCSELGLGSTSICAALLHDVVEDTDYTVEDLRALFGDKIAQIVDGLTKISSGMFGEEVSKQAENFRKLLLTMSDDVRVILVKIADRLHNMRTLSSMIPAKQYKISGETMYIYAPLAHRLGLFAIKTELEELCFKYEHPEVYQDLKNKISDSEHQRNLIYSHFAKPVKVSLDKLGIEYEMRARVKSVYSIWKKMTAKSIEFDQIYDLFAVRIIFDVTPGIDEKTKCWEIYAAITSIYKLRPDRIRDWISSPKANGYQALHLTVMGPDGQWIEIQIRSRRMDDIAEKGFAAHWKYKEGKIEEDAELEKWLKTIQEILSNPNPNAIDFLDSIKMNLYSSEIFVFTPRGDLKTMPHGSTALDFAYMLHSNIGDHCLGAKVNHRLVPLSQKLASGDQIEVLSLDTQHPTEEWLNYVVTAKAREKIESYLRRERKTIAELGRKHLEDLFPGNEIDQPTLNKILHRYKIDKKEILYYKIATKEIPLPDKLYKMWKEEDNDGSLLGYMIKAYKAVTGSSSGKKENGENGRKDVGIDKKKVYELLQKSNSRNFNTLNCCSPVAGDDVFGFVNDNNTLDLHMRSCENGIKLKSNFGDRIVEVKWGDYDQYTFKAPIIFTGIDNRGILNSILMKVLEEKNIDIKEVNVFSNDGIFEGKIVVVLHSVKDIQYLCSKISKVKGVNTVHRQI